MLHTDCAISAQSFKGNDTMAKFINMTSFSGTLGEFVGCMAPSGFYIRSRPRKSRKPPSVRQQEIRAKMALVGSYLFPMKQIIYMGFAASYRVKSKTAAMNRAVAHALRHAVGGAFPDLHIIPGQVVLSQGGVVKLTGMEWNVLAGQLHVKWELRKKYGAFADDKVFILAYNAAAKNLEVGEVAREAGYLVMDLHVASPGSVLHIYVCVSNWSEKEFSNSEYLGSYTV